MSAGTVPTLHDVRAKRREILRILTSRGARNPRVFGSVARGEDLQDELSEILGRPVHVNRAAGVSKGARRILTEAVPL